MSCAIPTLRGVILTLWTTNIPYGFLIVALPVLILREFHWGADGVGLLWSVAGVATVLAGLVAGRINTEGRERQIIVGGMVLAALACVCILLQSPVALLAGMALLRPCLWPYRHWPLRAAPATHGSALVRSCLRRLDEPEFRWNACRIGAGWPHRRAVDSARAAGRGRHLSDWVCGSTACHSTRRVAH